MFSDGESAVAAVCMSSAPTSHCPTRPTTRAPPRMGTCWPLTIPIRREWNSRSRPPREKSKMSDRSWKNWRFSGKKRLNRVRLTCWSSASTCAKSVLTVRSSVRLLARPYLASRPISPTRSVSAV